MAGQRTPVGKYHRAGGCAGDGRRAPRRTSCRTVESACCRGRCGSGRRTRFGGLGLGVTRGRRYGEVRRGYRALAASGGFGSIERRADSCGGCAEDFLPLFPAFAEEVRIVVVG